MAAVAYSRRPPPVLAHNSAPPTSPRLHPTTAAVAYHRHPPLRPPASPTTATPGNVTTPQTHAVVVWVAGDAVAALDGRQWPAMALVGDDIVWRRSGGGQLGGRPRWLWQCIDGEAVVTGERRRWWWWQATHRWARGCSGYALAGHASGRGGVGIDGWATTAVRGGGQAAANPWIYEPSDYRYITRGADGQVDGQQRRWWW